MTPSTELALFTTTTLSGCILSFACLPWQINSMDIDFVLLSSWLLVGCFMLFVNSIAMNALIWCDISTKLMIGAYIGVPASMICVLHRLYMSISAPDSLPDKRFYQLLSRLALMLGMPALIIVAHIIVQDRRYTFIEQAGCIPSVSPSLFPLIAILIWPLLFSVASLAYLGLVIRFIWVSRQIQGEIPTSSGRTTLRHLLRLSISLFLGVALTGSFSLLLLLSIVNNTENISVDSLHHDFQTIYVITTDQWLRNPQLHTAVELRWLWATLGLGPAIGLFPKERVDWILGLFAGIRLYIRKRMWYRSASAAFSHGSLPVYISRSSSSTHGETPILPSLNRQSTLALTDSSRVSSVPRQQPEVPPHIPQPDTRSWESIRRNGHSKSQRTSQPGELPQLNQSLQLTNLS